MFIIKFSPSRIVTETRVQLSAVTKAKFVRQVLVRKGERFIHESKNLKRWQAHAFSTIVASQVSWLVYIENGEKRGN